MRGARSAFSEINKVINPLSFIKVRKGYLKELPPDGMSMWEYSQGYRTPIVGAFRDYQNSRSNGASLKAALLMLGMPIIQFF